MPSQPEIACIAQTEDVVGEVPVWSAEEQALYWIDVFKPAIHRWRAADGVVASWTPPEKLGALALADDGRLLLAARSGLALFAPGTGGFDIIARPEADRPDNILNEGKCDRRGRFWVGSMDRRLVRDSGRLHRLDGDGSCHVMDAGIWIPNGLAWSPDDRLLYFADSHRKLIYAYPFDLASGEVGDRRVFADTADRPGVPDGAAIDAEGFLWSAHWDGGCLVRYAPDGRVDRVVALPVTRPAACAFGGPGLATLFVTTARFRLTAETLAAMHREMSPQPPSDLNPAITPELEQIMMKVLAKEPSARYRTADQLGRVLMTFGQARQSRAVALTPELPEAGETPVLGTRSENVPQPPIPTLPVRQPTTTMRVGEPAHRASDEPLLDDEETLDIDWVTIGLQLLVFLSVGGLIPFWIFIYLRLVNPVP